MSINPSVTCIHTMLLVLGTWFIVLPSTSAGTGRKTVTGIEALGVVTFDTGFMFAATEVGGLSGITYDSQAGVYYALSDDRSQNNPARYYTVAIDLSDGSLDDGDVRFLAVTFLRDRKALLFSSGSIDPEGITLGRHGQLFISSEGHAGASPVINPFVNCFNADGKQNCELTVPDKFLPDGTETFGVRDNRAFESLTSTPNYQSLYTASENALVQDGPPSTLDDLSPARLIAYDIPSKKAPHEFVYFVSSIPRPGGSADNGLVELQALDNHGTFMAMERSFAAGVGNTVVLYEISTEGATDVSGFESLLGETFTPTSKKRLADFEMDLGINPDNLEGMSFGPVLSDGRRLLIVVSDNNFKPAQTTQFVALAVQLKTVNDELNP